MPTYDYECQSCEHRFEKYQAITAKPVRTCPRCGRRKVRRLIGAGAGILYRKAAEKDKSGQKGSETGKKPSDETGKKPSDSKAPTDAPAKSEPGEKAEKHS